MQSLEDTPMDEIEEASYTHHVSEQLDMETTEQRHKIVKKLLERLPESERTVGDASLSRRNESKGY